jgi:lipopolysaccharide export system protein LptA
MGEKIMMKRIIVLSIALFFLVGNAHLVQGFDSFSGDTLNYDINNDKVVVKGSEDGTERVKFKIVL